MAVTSQLAAEDTALGAVHLTVADLDRMRDFYERVVGLHTLGTPVGRASMGVGDDVLVELIGEPEAPPRPPRTTGLFHQALLVPSRAELARVLQRVTAAGWAFSGASDHLVSEALYLNDPEGNGIEIYRDRPRDEWPHRGGQLEMATLPLDVDGVVAEMPQDPDPGMAPGTRVGHVHLNVADLDAAEAFYCRVLGFDVTVRGYPGALFVSTGGYHHHIGLNTWNGEGASAPAVGSRGLEVFELRMASPDALAELVTRLPQEGVEPRPHERGTLVRDPSGNGVLLTTA